MSIRLLATGVAVAGMAACYSQKALPPAAIASLTAPLPRPTTLGPDARLGPRTDVRVRFGDGSTSRWWPASSLAAGDDGLIMGSGRYRLADAHEAVIAGADAGASEVLAATAPPGASMAPGEHGLRHLRLADSRRLLSWIAAYVNGAATLGRESGALSFRGPGGAWESPPIPGGRLTGLTAERLQGVSLAEGVPWRDVSAVELDNLAPWSTIGAVIGLPLAAVILLPVGLRPLGAIGEGPLTDRWLPDATTSGQATEGYPGDPGDSPAPVGHHRRTAVLLDGPKELQAPGEVPWFTPSARRRDQLKVVLGGDFGVESLKDGTFTGSAGVGVRLFDFLEITGRARSVTFDDRGPAAAVGGAGSGSPGPGLSRHLLGGARLSLHLDADGNPTTAFVVGGELMAGVLEGGGTLTELAFVLGPRYGLGDDLFVSFLFTPSILFATNTGTLDHSRGRMMFCAELGFDL